MQENETRPDEVTPMRKRIAQISEMLWELSAELSNNWEQPYFSGYCDAANIIVSDLLDFPLPGDEGYGEEEVQEFEEVQAEEDGTSSELN